MIYILGSRVFIFGVLVPACENRCAQKRASAARSRQGTTNYGSIRSMKRSVTEEGPDPIDRFVGGRIRGRRLGLRVSQTKLGHAIGVTFQQVQKYESGTNRVGASNLFRIAKALGVDVSFFFEGLTGESPAMSGMILGMADNPVAEFEGDPMSSRESFELMHNYFRIADPQVRKRIFALVRVLANASEAG
ncbi:MAG: helix-turn-helix domain-containing protein [Hyphomicrobium sp.]